MNISIVGTGYVGLITGTTFAKLGNSVTLVDVVKEKVDAVNSGRSPIYEKGLAALLKDLVEAGKLSATTDMEEAVRSSEITFVAVGTPSREDGSIDLSHIYSAVEVVSNTMRNKKSYHLVVIKSTVIPGTTGSLIPLMEKHSGKRAGKDFGVAMNPEFLREGVALEDSMNPDRIVLGVNDSKSERILRELYSPLKAPLLFVSPTTAEMIKYTANAFLATKISFSNEIANICDRFGVDVDEVMRGIGLDHRISPYFLQAGAGFGGSCFPKDVKALISASVGSGYTPHLLKEVIELNDRQPLRMIELAERYSGSIDGKKVAVLGLSFKPETDDIRESRAIPLVRELIERGASVTAYDPQATENFRRIFPGILYTTSAEEALIGADICMIQADWSEFGEIDYDKYGLELVVDGRRTQRGESETPYVGIGRSVKMKEGD